METIAGIVHGLGAMNPVTAAISAAGASTIGVGAALFNYNRENYKMDQKLHYSRFVAGNTLAIAQTAQYREDLIDLSSLTVIRADVYHSAAAMSLTILTAFACPGRLGLHTSPPPGWMMGLEWGNIGGAYIFLGLTMWLAMHAAMRADTAVTHMLTRFVRLPVPNTMQMDSARKFMSNYEDVSFKEVFRIPLMKHGKSGGQEDGIDIDAGAHRRLRHGGDVPNWYKQEKLVDLENSHIECMMPYGARGTAPEHFEVFREIQNEWWPYDVYARVCVFLALMHLLHAWSYLQLGHQLQETRAIFSVGTFIFPVFFAQQIIISLDILPNHSNMPIQPLRIGPFGPVVAYVAGAIEYSRWYQPETEGFAFFLVYVAYAIHFAYTLQLINVCRPSYERPPQASEAPGASWWPSHWKLPAAFSHGVWIVAPPKDLEPGNNDLAGELRRVGSTRGEGYGSQPKVTDAEKREDVHKALGPQGESPAWGNVYAGLIALLICWVWLAFGFTIEIINQGTEHPSLLSAPGLPNNIRDPRWRVPKPGIHHPVEVGLGGLEHGPLAGERGHEHGGGAEHGGSAEHGAGSGHGVDAGHGAAAEHSAAAGGAAGSEHGAIAENGAVAEHGSAAEHGTAAGGAAGLEHGSSAKHDAAAEHVAAEGHGAAADGAAGSEHGGTAEHGAAAEHGPAGNGAIAGGAAGLEHGSSAEHSAVAEHGAGADHGAGAGRAGDSEHGSSAENGGVSGAGAAAERGVARGGAVGSEHGAVAEHGAAAEHGAVASDEDVSELGAIANKDSHAAAGGEHATGSVVSETSASGPAQTEQHDLAGIPTNDTARRLNSLRAAERRELIGTLRHLLPHLHGLAREVRAHSGFSSEAVGGRSVELAANLPPRTSVNWPPLFEPRLLACAPGVHKAEDGRRLTVVLSPHGRGAVVAVDAETEGVAEMPAEVFPFALEGVAGFGPLAAATWDRAGLLLLTSVGVALECPGPGPVAGRWSCVHLVGETLRLGSGTERFAGTVTVTRHLERPAELKAAISFLGEDSIALYSRAAAGDVYAWRLVGEASVVVGARRGWGNAQVVAASFDENHALLLTSHEGALTRMSTDGRASEVAAAPLHKGMAHVWQAACSLEDGHVARLALQRSQQGTQKAVLFVGESFASARNEAKS
eukprot:TRINITY_DN7762_c0_g2_i1.p1 TRINITY_DN7762_c0_g2~~TRINITY_DN7762_c0_g2_i1.p1  ORF type:complete len:1153 (+),score=185.48 TRINITY_DN7762_c0_g2_i1:104-3562(+)